MLSDLRSSLMVLAIVMALTIIMRVVRNFRPHRLNLAQQTLISTNFGFFSTLYTFFLGFAVVSLWQSYNNADAFVTNEAQLLLAEYRLSESVPNSIGFRKALLDYVSWIKDQGWDEMQAGKTNDGADAYFAKVWKELRAMKPSDSADRTSYTLVAEKLTQLDSLREGRMDLIDGNLYTPIWVVIYLGVLFTIGGFYFTDSGSKFADWFFILMMTTMVMANIFLIYELDTPFSGYIHIGPEKFQTLFTKMQSLYGAGL